MIIALHLTNFTIIDALDLEFKSGMSVLTGETGAGKSIIIDAIQLALGERLDTKVVREGCDKSTITLTFDISNNSAAKSWLQEHELLSENECILRRTISHDGKSRAFINGTPATLQLLSELGALLIKIQGQHQQQALTQKNSQLDIIDQYGNLTPLLNEIAITAQRWNQAKKDYDSLFQKSRDAKSQLDFLRFQLAEFEKLGLKENELDQLDLEHKKLSNADTLLTNCHAVMDLISDQDNNLHDQINHCLHRLETIKKFDPALNNAYELLNAALIQMVEVEHEIKHYQEQIDLNPHRLQEIESRLSAMYELARKHRIQVKELKAFETKLLSELHSLENPDSKLQILSEQLSNLEKQYRTAANSLSSKRKKYAEKLSKLITRDIQSLNMQGGKFQITLHPINDPSPNPLGQERAEFLVAANTGQRLQPLSKVASGGELSRISLAIQVNIAKTIETPVLIFDEVDTGIGGATADIVGRLLQRLSAETQVFCITHLPQVASKAKQHLKVEKYVKQKQTFTTVKTLNPEERIDEIARMLGGLEISKESLEHAKVLLATAVPA